VGRKRSRLAGKIAVLVLVGGWACSSGPSAPDESAYLNELSTFRAVKDRQFLDQPECGPRVSEDECSPVPANKRTAMLPLHYYPPDPTYAVPAALKLANERPTLDMPTSTGQLRKMQRVGVLEFTFQGQSLSLGAFVEDGTQQITKLFVPFADMTTGSETYPAGRYLDLSPTSTGFYTIDFNHAYNPYCAYNATYDCPFPPASNRLKVPIRAGEKSPGA
jgi:hypothetical protein